MKSREDVIGSKYNLNVKKEKWEKKDKLPLAGFEPTTFE